MNRVLLLIVSIVALLAAAPGPALAQSPLQPCTIDGVMRQAQCGLIEVPEDRGQPSGRTLAVNVVVLKAAGPTQPDAVLFFAGGPGQGGATLARNVARELDAVAPDRDIILVDQRGTGRSRPLTCEGGFGVLEPANVDALVACREALRSAADLDDFGSDESADDAADVVRVLGYAQVNVIGVSYGTRLAGHFAARHPALVRTIVQRAIAPTGFNVLLDGGRNARAGMDRLLADCRADAACAAAFPDLERALVALRARLREMPVPLSADMLDITLYGLLLTAETRQIVPWLVHAAATGNTLALAAVAKQVQAVYDSVALGAYLSVVCSEDAPRLTATERRELQGTFSAGTHMVVAACDQWQVAAAPAMPPPSRRPTLVLSGEIDPAMPPESVERVLATMPSATHVVLPATAHGPTFPGCAVEIVRTFIQSAGADRASTACLNELTLPPFRTQ